jgi:hypothetical protein
VLILSLTEKEDYALAEWRKNGVDTDITLKDCPKLLRLFRRIWIKLHLPLEHIWYGDWKRVFKKYDCILVHGTWMAERVPRWIRKKAGRDIKIIWWYWNKVTKADHPERVLEQDCEKWSFDQEDCKKYGMHYSSNLCDDDRPYQKDLENGETLLEIPIHWDNYDLPYFAFNYHPAFPKGQGRIANYTGVINNWKDEFYGCYEYGLCYVLQLDPAAIGAPGRIGLLEELLDYIDEFDSVWWTSGEEMYQYYQNK